MKRDKPTRQHKLEVIEREMCRELLVGVDLLLDAAYRLAMKKRGRRLTKKTAKKTKHEK